MVFIYHDLDSVESEPNNVVFKTGPYERTFALSELDTLSEIVDVDESGNRVSFNSFLTTPEDRDRGFLKGRWVKAGGSEQGVFIGRWTSWDGLFMGHVKGHWGVNAEGERVFFGKWINRHGAFRGLLRGTWEIDDVEGDAVEPTSGSFRGVWADRSHTIQGDVGGEWTTMPYRSCDGCNGEGNGYGGTNGDGNSDGRARDGEIGDLPRAVRGFFHGRWAKSASAQ
jgi:hypothetical protein